MSARKEIRVQLDKAIGRTIQKLALAITANLIEITPVDTGFARANWVPSIRSPYRGIDKSGGAQASGIASLSGYRSGVVFISNNTRYIRILDQGSSKQAPAGFVRSAVLRGIAEVQSGSS